MDAREEAFEKAGFTNDMVFREVMRIRPHICRKIIKICCPDMDTENMTAVTEHEVIASIEDRRVRLNVLSEKEGDRVDIEMYRYEPGKAEGIELGREEGVETGEEEAVINAIRGFRHFGIDDERICAEIMERNDLTKEKALKLMKPAD